MSDSDRYYGKYRGLVQVALDPETDGRVTALVTVGSVPLLVVAEAVTPFAGAGMGFFGVPPVGAGIWIEFEEGDINKPVWSGCWWPSGQLKASLSAAADLTTLPLVMQSLMGNRLVISTVGPECITLETLAAEAGPRIVLATDSLTLSFGPAVSIVLSVDGVKICGEALKVLPG